jgi:hypothetical protein
MTGRRWLIDSAGFEKLKPLGMRAGYHNHSEWIEVEESSLEVIAANAPKTSPSA